MRWIKPLLKAIAFVMLLPIIYAIVALILSNITVNQHNQQANKQIYLSTNGVHLDIVLHRQDINQKLVTQLNGYPNTAYFSFGWGDANFYLNTPTWGDLTFNTAAKALFLDSETLVHLTRYQQKQQGWTAVSLNEEQLKKLNDFLLNTFKTDTNQKIFLLPNKGYTKDDDFYEANGNYHCFNTCNSWANKAFKESNLKACVWTPFDFGLLDLHQK